MLLPLHRLLKLNKALLLLTEFKLLLLPLLC
jgi:hypothetical protein